MTVQEIRLLGPVEVIGGRGVVRLGGVRQRTLCGLLALRAPDVISREALIEGLWDVDPPAHAHQTIRAHVAYLRQALLVGGAGQPVVTQPPGYALAVSVERVDVHWFEKLVRRARSATAAGAHRMAADGLRQALQLWRGEVLADCTAGPWAQAEAARLHETRLYAIEELLTAELALGLHAQVAAELASLVTRHPLRERMWELLMLALYRGGRPGDALYAYRRARAAIVEQLGLEPGIRLRGLESAILRHAGQPLDANL